MKFLLDTHAFLWWNEDPRRFSPEMLARLRDRNNEVWFSFSFSL